MGWWGGGIDEVCVGGDGVVCARAEQQQTLVVRMAPWKWRNRESEYEQVSMYVCDVGGVPMCAWCRCMYVDSTCVYRCVYMCSDVNVCVRRCVYTSPHHHIASHRPFMLPPSSAVNSDH